MPEKKELALTEEKFVEIETERLESFENHSFKVKADSQMIELQESVKKVSGNLRFPNALLWKNSLKSM